MKLNQLYIACVCYFTLAAFVGFIGLGALSFSKPEHQKVEVSASCYNFTAWDTLGLEEDECTTDLEHFGFLSQMAYTETPFLLLKKPLSIAAHFDAGNELKLCKLSLFMSTRRLRI